MGWDGMVLRQGATYVYNAYLIFASLLRVAMESGFHRPLTTMHIITHYNTTTITAGASTPTSWAYQRLTCHNETSWATISTSCPQVPSDAPVRWSTLSNSPRNMQWRPKVYDDDDDIDEDGVEEKDDEDDRQIMYWLSVWLLVMTASIHPSLKK